MPNINEPGQQKHQLPPPQNNALHETTTNDSRRASFSLHSMDDDDEGEFFVPNATNKNHRRRKPRDIKRNSSRDYKNDHKNTRDVSEASYFNNKAANHQPHHLLQTALV